MAQTQNLILRIVAQRGQISSRELTDVTEKFGLSSDATRAAANRMVQAELLTKTGRGRGNLFYKVGPQAQAIIEQLVAKVLHLHLAPDDPYAWTGHWLVVSFSVPEEQRDKRDSFRIRLTELGFGLLSAGVWLSPYDLTTKVTALIEELEVTGYVTLLLCERLWVPGGESIKELAYRVWELAKLEPLYHAFIQRLEGMLAVVEQVKQGVILDTEQVFFQAVDLQAELIDILTQDPCLPVELLPPDWPSQQAHDLFHLLTDQIDQLGLADNRYSYLLYSVPKGMESLERFWPQESHPVQGSAEGSQA